MFLNTFIVSIWALDKTVETQHPLVSSLTSFTIHTPLTLPKMCGICPLSFKLPCICRVVCKIVIYPEIP